MSGVTAMQEETTSTGVVGGTQEYVTLTVAGQWFGIPVLDVQDVLGPRPVAYIPLADKVVAGSINLRGRIVTVIDMRKHLGLPPREDDDPGMNIVVEQSGTLYSLRIDAVGEVMSPPESSYDRNPATIDPMWRDFSDGIYRLENQLLIILAVKKLLERNN